MLARIFFFLSIIFNSTLSMAECKFNTSNYIFAGAPALNEDPIPPAPYSLTKTNHLIIGVEWDKKSIEK